MTRISLSPASCRACPYSGRVCRNPTWFTVADQILVSARYTQQCTQHCTHAVPSLLTAANHATSCGQVFAHELSEICVAVCDHPLVNHGRCRFPGPDGLSRWTVAVEFGSGDGDPVAQAFPGGGEVGMPADRGGAVLLGVVGTQPMQVQRGQFPDQLWMPMPQRGNDRREKTVIAPEPVNPFVQIVPQFKQDVMRRSYETRRVARFCQSDEATELGHEMSYIPRVL